jgi:hypothetical protein
MAELATRDGGPPPAGLPHGECICTRLDDGTIRIDHADPRILISGELLAATMGIRNGLLPLQVSELDLTGCAPGHGYVGAVLRIHGVNRQVVYRITDMVPRINGYIGEWPD